MSVLPTYSNARLNMFLPLRLRDYSYTKVYSCFHRKIDVRMP